MAENGGSPGKQKPSRADSNLEQQTFEKLQMTTEASKKNNDIKAANSQAASEKEGGTLPLPISATTVH